jgi:hypothetical protein
VIASAESDFTTQKQIPDSETGRNPLALAIASIYNIDIKQASLSSPLRPDDLAIELVFPLKRAIKKTEERITRTSHAHVVSEKAKDSIGLHPIERLQSWQVHAFFKA